jgi:hypothetical protein
MPQSRKARSPAHPRPLTDSYPLWWIDMRDDRECSTATLESGNGARIFPAWGFALTAKKHCDQESNA